MTKISKYRRFCAFILLSCLMFGSGCVATKLRRMDFPFEIELDGGERDFRNETVFLVVAGVKGRSDELGGFALYHDALSAQGINAYIIPKELIADPEYYLELGETTISLPSINFPKLDEASTRLGEADRADFRQNVSWFLRRYEARERKDGLPRLGDGFLLSQISTPRHELKVENINATLRSAVEGFLLYRRFPNLGRVFERITYRMGRRFSNGRACPFSGFGQEIVDVEYAFYWQDDRRIGCLRIHIPWNYRVDELNGGSLMRVSKVAAEKFIALLCAESRNPAKYVGAISHWGETRRCEITNLKKEETKGN